jgi:hypothetical protein
MWLYNDETVSHVPSLSQFDLDLWPWSQIFYYRKRQKSYDSDTITLQKYQLFDLEVKGQRQNVVNLHPNIIHLSEETKKLWPVTLSFFPYWPYISFIERRVPVKKTLLDAFIWWKYQFLPEIFDFHCGATMILTNVTPKHSELSIFWLFIYSLCCYEWFLFVHCKKNTYIINQKIIVKSFLDTF